MLDVLAVSAVQYPAHLVLQGLRLNVREDIQLRFGRGSGVGPRVHSVLGPIVVGVVQAERLPCKIFKVT